MHDVVVVGAGPAGSVTARRLAEAGHHVLMLEEHGTPGLPSHCTGLLGFDAFDAFALPRDVILGEATSARFWGTAGHSVLVRSDRVRAAVIDRVALDRDLAERAGRAGVEIRTSARADRIDVGPRSVTVAIRDGHAVTARVAVLACGANYRFHKALQLGVPPVFLQSVQLETPFPEAGSVEVRFGRNLAPAGFGWLVPLQRAGRWHARIGLMSQTRSRERFAALVGALCERAGLDPADMPEPRMKMLPLAPISRTYADRVLAVGDAAGLVKPTTGGGIFYAMVSGALAADVLSVALGRDRLDAGALRAYESSWRRELGREIRAGLAFRRIVSGLSDESIDALIELSRVDGVVPLLQKTASFNWHRKAAVALLKHPAVRRIVLKSWRESVSLG
ncbi:MAG: NAD(P)/FAD-dependent oxidoreductase [Acidobacteria bacterium]|nr:NAD(P)/FAD-dependent oxidoreductase [Acidobacteriota bacterium]